ncbi:hypothetical protein EBR77_03640 [bacterium]|nr:hypothetical protein [bacterium]NBX78323.1 hypothetical protein [bacterium]
MNRNYIFLMLCVIYAEQILSLDQHLIEQKKQKAISVLHHHEYKAYLYSAVFAGMVAGALYNIEYFQPLSTEIKLAQKPSENWFYTQGKNVLGVVYSAGKAQVISYIGSIIGGSLAAMPISVAIKNDVVSSFARANMPWFIQYHTQFHTHIKQATQRAHYWIVSIKNQNMVERDAVVPLLQEDIKNLEQDCYALLGALQALQDQDYLEINQAMYDLHYKKTEATLNECMRQLMLSEEQVVSLAEQRKDIAFLLENFQTYINLIFI